MISNKKILILNSLTILISLYKLIHFVSKFKADFFAWWLPLGKIFSYILFYQFTTFFLIPIPFGVYFIVLVFYIFAAIFLLLRSTKRETPSKDLLFSILILIGAIGSFVIFIGE